MTAPASGDAKKTGAHDEPRSHPKTARAHQCSIAPKLNLSGSPTEFRIFLTIGGSVLFFGRHSIPSGYGTGITKA
jgi:hypothetical protein